MGTIMKRHIKYDHEGKELDQCPHCNKKFKGKQTLKIHIDLVHEKKSTHLCTHCGKSFFSTQTLNVHINTVHLKIRQHCHLCDKTYNHKAKLQLHIKKVHEKNNPRFPCPFGCKRTFLDLKDHIKTVHEKKNHGRYICKICNKMLCGQGNLNKHIATVHEGARPFGCEFCGRTFTTKQHRDNHEKRTHDGMKREVI